MLVTITNLASKPARQYLESNKRKFPPFRTTSYNTYNGVIVNVDDDNVEEFLEAMDHEGFTWDADEDELKALRSDQYA
jgi:hypothetical protein